MQFWEGTPYQAFLNLWFAKTMVTVGHILKAIPTQTHTHTQSTFAGTLVNFREILVNMALCVFAGLHQTSHEGAHMLQVRPGTCLKLGGLHENDRDHKNDSNRTKKRVEFWICRNHGNHENNEPLESGVQTTQTTGLEIPNHTIDRALQDLYFVSYREHNKKEGNT